MIQYPSLNGKMLWAILIKTDQPPKGTVVHFHGNFGNLSNHFPLAVFLVKNGFDVLAFDYEGYGASQGHPSPKNIVNDGIAHWCAMRAGASAKSENRRRRVRAIAGRGGAAIVGRRRERRRRSKAVTVMRSQPSVRISQDGQGSTPAPRHWTWPFSYFSRRYSRQSFLRPD